MAWWRRFLRSAPTEPELLAEVHDHLERLVAEHRARGASEAEARRLAALAFGHRDSIAEACRDVRRTRWLEDLGRDLHYALRGVRQSPGFAAAMIATIALGLGVATALFAVLDAVVLRPLALPASERLAAAATIDTRDPAVLGPVSWPDFQDWRTIDGAFDGLAAFRNRQAFVQGATDDVAVEQHEVTTEFLPLLGVPMERGRAWTADEARAGAAPPVVISHAVWRDLYGGRPDVVGQRLEISRVSYAIVGVMPAGFASPSMTSIGAIRAVAGARGVDALHPEAGACTARQSRLARAGEAPSGRLGGRRRAGPGPPRRPAGHGLP